jgi:hypothetical protein
MSGSETAKKPKVKNGKDDEENDIQMDHWYTCDNLAETTRQLKLSEEEKAIDKSIESENDADMEVEDIALERTFLLTTVFKYSSSDPLRMNTTDQIKRLLPTDKETEAELGAQFLKSLLQNITTYMEFDRRGSVTAHLQDVLKAAKMLGFTVPASMHDPLLDWSSMCGDRQITPLEICDLDPDPDESEGNEFLASNEIRRIVCDVLSRKHGSVVDDANGEFDEEDDADIKIVIEHAHLGLFLLQKECKSLFDKAEDDSGIFVQPTFRLSVEDFALAFHFVSINETPKNDIAVTRSAMNLIQQLMEVVIFGNLGLNVVRDGVSPCDSPSLLTLELDGIKFECQLYSPSDVFYTEFTEDSNDDDDDHDEWVPNVTDGEDDNDEDDDSFADEANITTVDLLRST